MNKKNITFSIIIPCYNIESHVPTIGRLIQQSYKNFEIIAIDDCSTDKTTQILENLVCLYDGKNIPMKVIKNECNLGAGGSRNVGLKEAKGDYIVFLDADDYLEHDALFKLDECISNNSQPDIVLFDYYETSDCSKKRFQTFSFSSFVSLEKAFLFSPNGVCGKCVKNSLIKDHKISFTNSTRNEDYPFFRIAYLYSNNIFYLAEPLYNYVMNPKSLMHNYSLNSVDYALTAFETISLHTQDINLLTKAFMKNCYFSNIGTMIVSRWKRKEFSKRLKFLRKEYNKFYSIGSLLVYGLPYFVIVIIANLGLVNTLRLIFKIKGKL